MKLESVTITEFKRFTKLTIQGVRESACLIMLAGPNGSGKSSLFDAFNIWHRKVKRPQYSPQWERDYHSKTNMDIRDVEHQIEIAFHEGLPPEENEKKKIFYIRSAYRNDPEFTISELRRVGALLDEQIVQRMIDNDAAVAKNYQRMAAQAFEDVFEHGDESMTLKKFRELIVGETRDSFTTLFPDLVLNSLANPLVDGTFRFTKGASRGFAFKNLSGGEKAAFDLILDIIVRRREYDNTIFCIDEPESHMNAQLQARLLSALYQLIPSNCQLFMATHSIGMMRRARDIESENPGSVAFLNFGGRNFDQRQTIEPTAPNRRFWEQAYEVALDDLAALVAPSEVVICEGQPIMQDRVRNHNHDARCYDAIFGDEFPETRFVSMGSDQQILGDQRGLAEALQLLVRGLKVTRLIDRDDRTDATITEESAKGVRVLSRRNLESYLYDDEVLKELAKSNDRSEMIDDLLAEKRNIIASSSGASDDLKPASGQLFVACRSILNLRQRGNNAEEFARETLAPLVRPGMAVYQELRQDIFGVNFESEVSP